jgi:D-galactarolactone cycloisomerase
MYMEQGYRTVKVKVGGLTPEADAERVGLIRRAVGKGVAIMLDANQGWDYPTAVRAAQLCAPHDIFWLEDPMPWYDERHTLQKLKAAVSIPIAAGETEASPFGLRTMVAEGLVDYLIIDSTWAGGLTTWRKAAVVAELYQVPLAAHHDPQIHVHAVVASPTGFILESFADPTRDPLWFELFRERPPIIDGSMALPEAPGLGLELRDETLEKYGVKLG